MTERSEVMQRLSLPVVEAAQVRLGNLLLAKSEVLLPIPPGKASGAGIAIKGLFDNRPALLWVPEGTFRAIAPETSGLESIEGLPDPLLAALAEVSLRKVLKAYANELGHMLRISEAAVEDAPQAFGIGLRVGATAEPTVLQVDDAAMAEIAERLASQPDLAPLPGSETMPVSLAIETASLAVTLGELRTLGAADVLLLAAGTDPADLRLTQQPGGRVLATVRITDDGLVVQGVLGAEMADENDDAPPPEGTLEGDAEETSTDIDDPGPALDVDALDVTLSFSIGSVELSVAELRALQKGYIFEPEAPLASPVRIYAGRRAVGEGELVELDGRVGVRVLRLTGTRA